MYSQFKTTKHSYPKNRTNTDLQSSIKHIRLKNNKDGNKKKRINTQLILPLRKSNQYRIQKSTQSARIKSILNKSNNIKDTKSKFKYSPRNIQFKIKKNKSYKNINNNKLISNLRKINSVSQLKKKIKAQTNQTTYQMSIVNNDEEIIQSLSNATNFITNKINQRGNKSQIKSNRQKTNKEIKQQYQIVKLNTKRYFQKAQMQPFIQEYQKYTEELVNYISQNQQSMPSKQDQLVKKYNQMISKNQLMYTVLNKLKMNRIDIDQYF